MPKKLSPIFWHLAGFGVESTMSLIIYLFQYEGEGISDQNSNFQSQNTDSIGWKCNCCMDTKLKKSTNPSFRSIFCLKFMSVT